MFVTVLSHCVPQENHLQKAVNTDNMVETWK